MNEYNDNELLYLLSENEDFAFDILLEKYEPMILNRLKRFRVKSDYWDDYYQECIILLYRCAVNYREDITKTFNKYYDRLLQFHIQNLLRKDRNDFYKIVLMSREEIDALTHYKIEDKKELKGLAEENIELDEKMIKMLYEGKSINEISHATDRSYYQTYKIINKYLDNNKIKVEGAKKFLSNFEYSIFELYKKGYRPIEIGEILEIETRKVYYAMKRIRLKQKKLNGEI